MTAAQDRKLETVSRTQPGTPGPRAPGGSLAGEKPKSAGDAARRIWAAFGSNRKILVVTVLLSLGSVIGSSIGPWQLGLATNLLVGDDFTFAALMRQLLLVAAIYLVASGLNFAQAWLVNDLVQNMGRDLRNAAQAKLARVPLRWFDTQPRGEILSRFTNDIDNMVQNLQQVASQAMLMLMTVIGVLAMMVLLSVPLALAAIAAICVSVGVTRILSHAAQPRYAEQWRETGHLNSLVEEAFTGQALIRVHGAHDRVNRRFADRNDALTAAGMRAQVLASLIQPATMFVNNSAYIVVVVFGAFQVVAGALSIGGVQAFIQYIRQIGQPISQLGSMAAQVQSALASAERVFELLDAPEMSPDREDAAPDGPIRGDVRFEHVGFRYRADQPLFEDVSLDAAPGQMLAIVGPTGAGKTTLVNLLIRFYDIDSGVIRLDGRDIAAMPRDDLRRAMAMVLQDAWLFTGTIHDNIAYGRPEATREQVVAAARRCHVDDFVCTLPEGYDTVLDNGGSGLSQGQRQLMTIARAFLLDAPILILDEATSSVDTRTEMQIQTAMADLRQGRTSFVIAHRLSTIRDADMIVYMEDGNVRETGTHDQLMALEGGYRNLQTGTGATPELRPNPDQGKD
ncbi:ABC transporter ATP-binding protein [Paracoccus sp. 1_MG-2023]|uniref:ABC transporter ATP-binding protein n=1 Tax=unclassified Paracoccus (in: a-proteobacteria) TaxID=2688777 RepID=UPI001C092013|nr:MULTISPECIES: ABC transporter ATP-binding protein [unclassified Paracoccus (in: a-proteobacteria)]MBU2959190.1 ABC transporter ATP-binding protein/permease [Paracoccus sp. C2R09]MDO6670073.1 ABC transporter ATP-binding protein [Paracoccus sp. 1_MG-2023]